VDKTISIGIATCIISSVLGAGVLIAVSLEMITPTNAIYCFIGLGILLLVGIGFLVYGIRLRPKSISSIPTVNPQLGTIPKTTNPSNHKLAHSIICEISGMGLMVGGALMVSRNTSDLMSAFIGFMLVLFGFTIFAIGIAVGVGK